MNSIDFSKLNSTQVLVTGATGFTGQVLVRKLLAAGAIVRAIARGSSEISVFTDLKIEWIRGEVFDPELVSKAVAGVSYIFHVAAAYRQAKISDLTYHQVHVQSTKLLAQAALSEAKFERFVHVSTVGVHGHIDNPPADENYRFSPGDVYQRTKAEAEIWIREFATANSLPLTVIRPAAIYGPGDRRLFKVFKMASKTICPILGQGRCLYHLIHVDDLANIMISAALSSETVGQVLIAGNSQASSLLEMIDIISGVLGNKPRVIRLPVWPFYLAGFGCESICKPLGIEPPIYRRRVAFFTKDRAFDTQKMQKLLNYHYLYSNETGLIQTTKWYVEQGWLQASPNQGQKLQPLTKSSLEII